MSLDRFLDLAAPIQPAIVPLRPGTKVPAVKWKAHPPGVRAPDHADTVARALLTGARSGGVFVIDVDDIAALEGLERRLGPLPDTLTVRSPKGGLHLYYRSATPIKTQKNEIAKGIDVRGEGGIVVLPGSEHLSGGTYEIEDENAIHELNAGPWFDVIPKANVHAPAAPIETVPAADLATLRQKLADVARGKRGDGWESMRRAARGDRMLRLHGQVTQSDAPLALGLDEYITRQIVWPLAHEPEWQTVPPEQVAELFAPSLGILRSDSIGISETGTKFFPEEFARKFAQAATKAHAEAQDAANFLEKITSGLTNLATPGDPSWRTGLITSGTGKPTAGAYNIGIVLGHHPEIAGKIALDARSGKILIVGPLPWDVHASGLWDDTHTTRAAAWVESVAFFTPSTRAIHEGIVSVARTNQIDPFADYLNDLTWDGAARLDRWLTTYAGAEDTEYHRSVGAAWVISGVARAFVPGAKVDTMLVLEGAQGAFKSTLIRTLAGDQYFTDQIPDITTKDAKDALQGPAIVEVAEMEALSRREVAAVKAFLTITVDRFRPAYGRATEEKPRRCIFAGTTNPDGTGYLRDVTGGRRFWCVAAGRCDVEAMRRDRDQIWAEAVHRYRKGAKWWLSDAGEALAKVEAEARRDGDPWEEVLAGLNSLRPHEDGRGAYRGVVLPASAFDPSGVLGVVTGDQVLSMVGIEPSQRDKSKQMRIGQTLRALGWSRATVNGERVFLRDR